MAPSLTLLVRLTGLTGAGPGALEALREAEPDAGACWEAASAGSGVGPEPHADSKLVKSAATVTPDSAHAALDRTQTPQPSE
ncbi:MAG TPA: hypothetical protein VE462_05875 [Propionibacteriaceae bacterium]|nr:hypothetical protein [Propionibacteriaceae bacterium]